MHNPPSSYSSSSSPPSKPATTTTTTTTATPQPSSSSSTQVAASSSSSSSNNPTMEKRIENAEAQLSALRAQQDSLMSQLKNPPQQTVKNHIRLLHTYNEIRDVGLGLMGLIADRRGQRLTDVLGEFGAEEGD